VYKESAYALGHTSNEPGIETEHIEAKRILMFTDYGQFMRKNYNK
jgi:hypothetical protein